MASTMPKQAAAKQLGELLQEQQQPFILEVYLLERGYMKNKLNSESGFRCCSRNSGSRFLKRLTSRGSKKRRKVTPNCSKIVRAVFNKLVFISNKQRMKNSVSGDGNSSVKQEETESNRLSSATLQTWRSSISHSDQDQELNVNSWSEGDIEDGLNSLQKDNVSVTADTCGAFTLGDILQEKEVVTDGKLQWRCGKENKQLSPVSVLEEIYSNEGSPVHNKRQRNAKTYNIIAVPFGKFIARLKEPSCTAKMVLQQSKQLLSDCVVELGETCVQKNRRQQHLLEFPGPEEFGCEDARTWRNTTQLLNLDFTASVAEWRDFEKQTRQIGAEIGDAILEDISKEIVADMTTELVAPHLCLAT